MANVIFLTYLLETSPISGGTMPYASQVSYGYTTPIHCNYIQRIETDGDLVNARINFTFDEDLFPFMKKSSLITNGNSGQGWTAYKIKALAQVIATTGDTSLIEPDSSKWKSIDLTSQIKNHVAGKAIDPDNLIATLFEINPVLLPTYPYYRLSYLNYPNALAGDNNRLAFGEEVFFYGNVKTDIEAIGYSTDIAINLPINEFNYTENPTWDGESAVFISEIGIFDDANNLVAIGKLNHPVDKDSGKARAFAFNPEF